MNQCDGCRTGWTMRGPLHIDPVGSNHITCTKERYMTKIYHYTLAAFMNGGMLAATYTLPGETPYADPVTLHVVLSHWDAGHCELVAELMEYVDYAYQLVDAGVKAIGDCPGVYDYEVGETFGQWFGQTVLNSQPGTPPVREAACHELRRLAFNFFERGHKIAERPSTSAQVIALSDALNAVPLP